VTNFLDPRARLGRQAGSERSLFKLFRLEDEVDYWDGESR
jgi:hypothetical protein